MLGRRVVKVERTKLEPANRNGEVVFRVWYENDKYSYVWAKDELEAYKRATKEIQAWQSEMRNE